MKFKNKNVIDSIGIFIIQSFYIHLIQIPIFSMYKHEKYEGAKHIKVPFPICVYEIQVFENLRGT